MEDKVISMALRFPHSFNWRKKLELSIDEVNKILEKNELDSELKRRVLATKIRFNVLKESKIRNTSQQIIDEINKSKEIYVKNYVIKEMIKSLFLYGDENLVKYKKIFEGNIKINSKNDLKDYIGWIGEIVTYKNCLNSEFNKEKNIKEIGELLKRLDIVNSKKDDLEKNIIDLLKNRGLLIKENLEVIRDALKEYKAEFEYNFNQLFNIYKCEDDNLNINKDNNSNRDSGEDLADSLLGLFNEMKETTQEELNKKERSFIKEKDKLYHRNNTEDILKKNQSIYNNLNALANDLGYKVICKDDINLSVEKYESLVSRNEEMPVEIFKKLAMLENGAILSELYNSYKNIKNISKENLEAVLSSFFAYLKFNGLEVIEEDGVIGQSITVDSKNILKDFKVDSEIDIKESIEGSIRYLGWNYNGKRIAPMIISPKNE